MSKDEIISYVSTIVSFAIGDANTYLYAKCVPSFEADIRKVPIGGGNFTVLLISLATIDLLAQVDKHIDSKPNDYYSENEIDAVKKAKKEIVKLKSCLDLNLSDDLIKLNFFPRIPSKFDLKVGSGKVLRDFLNKTTSLTGLSKKEVEKLAQVRNKLVHEFNPKSAAAGSVGPVPGADFVSLILNYNQEIFIVSGNQIVVDSHALNHKLEKLLKYVVERLEALNENEDNFKNLSQFITYMQ